MIDRPNLKNVNSLVILLIDRCTVNIFGGVDAYYDEITVPNNDLPQETPDQLFFKIQESLEKNYGSDIKPIDFSLKTLNPNGVLELEYSKQRHDKRVQTEAQALAKEIIKEYGFFNRPDGNKKSESDITNLVCGYLAP